MDENQALLGQMGVSSPELEQLVSAARQAGASGAKLSGGGRGGNMIALARPEQTGAISQALLDAGARGVITTTIR
jgi:mevalonate kinase